MNIFRLIYFSGETRRLNQAELIELLSLSRARNEAAAITGILVYKEGIYIQILEGDEQAVRALYAGIQTDPRHTRVLTISEEHADDREFESWSMAFRIADSERPLAAEIPWPPTHEPAFSRGMSLGTSTARALRTFMNATKDPLDAA